MKMDSNSGWPVYNKLNMYKGLINIYERERKNQLHDSSLLIKENEQKIADLRSEVKKQRIKLSMSKKGATAEVATLLQENRPLQLILEKKSVEEMKEDLLIRTAKRKQFSNKLNEEIVQVEKKLVRTKLELDKLENENIEDHDKVDHRQTLNNRIQEFGAKTQLCRNIQNVYLKAINVLRKDQANYSAILEDMKRNAELQQISIVRAVEMGQLATEEMANMREEYLKREHDVRANMEMHINGLQAFQYKSSNLIIESQALVRAESATALSGDFFGKKEEDESELQKQVNQLNDLLLSIRKATLVPEFDGIHPRMLEQIRLNEKLLEDLEINDNLFDLLPKKITQAKLILAATINEGKENAALSIANRDLLSKELEEVNKEVEEIDKERQKVGYLVIQVKNGLACIWNLAKTIRTRTDVSTEDFDMNTEIGILNHAENYLKQLKIKTKLLQQVVNKKLRDEDYLRAISIKARRLMKIQKEEEEKETTQVTIQVGEDDEDPSVPTRADIKAESKKIYDLATINPFA